MNQNISFKNKIANVLKVQHRWITQSISYSPRLVLVSLLNMLMLNVEDMSVSQYHYDIVIIMDMDYRV